MGKTEKNKINKSVFSSYVTVTSLKQDTFNLKEELHSLLKIDSKEYIFKTVLQKCKKKICLNSK